MSRTRNPITQCHTQACPNLAAPYHTLGLLHEAMGSGRKALDFYMIAAHLTPKVGGRAVWVLN